MGRDWEYGIMGPMSRGTYGTPNYFGDGSGMGAGKKIETRDGSGSPIAHWVWERDGTGTNSTW